MRIEHQLLNRYRASTIGDIHRALKSDRIQLPGAREKKEMGDAISTREIPSVVPIQSAPSRSWKALRASRIEQTVRHVNNLTKAAVVAENDDTAGQRGDADASVFQQRGSIDLVLLSDSHPPG